MESSAATLERSRDSGETLLVGEAGEALASAAGRGRRADRELAVALGRKTGGCGYEHPVPGRTRPPAPPT